MGTEGWNPTGLDRRNQSRFASELMQQQYNNMMMGNNGTSISPNGWLGDNWRGTVTESSTKGAIAILEKIKKSAKPIEESGEVNEILSTKAQEYKDLGLHKIAKIIEGKATKVWRETQIALAGYTRINAEELNHFRSELRNRGSWDERFELLSTPLEQYIGQGIGEGAVVDEEDLGIPPTDVLDKLKDAQKSKLFDDFVVLSVERVPDPILCGTIAESKDLYFIAEWGDDVKLADIVK